MPREHGGRLAAPRDSWSPALRPAAGRALPPRFCPEGQPPAHPHPLQPPGAPGREPDGHLAPGPEPALRHRRILPGCRFPPKLQKLPHKSPAGPRARFSPNRAKSAPRPIRAAPGPHPGGRMLGRALSALRAGGGWRRAARRPNAAGGKGPRLATGPRRSVRGGARVVGGLRGGRSAGQGSPGLGGEATEGGGRGCGAQPRPDPRGGEGAFPARDAPPKAPGHPPARGQRPEPGRHGSASLVLTGPGVATHLGSRRRKERNPVTLVPRAGTGLHTAAAIFEKPRSEPRMPRNRHRRPAPVSPRALRSPQARPLTAAACGARARGPAGSSRERWREMRHCEPRKALGSFPSSSPLHLPSRQKKPVAARAPKTVLGPQLGPRGPRQVPSRELAPLGRRLRLPATTHPGHAPKRQAIP